MRILILYAVDAEFAPWRKLRDFSEMRTREVSVRQAQVGRALVDFVVTGMGAESARRVADAVMDASYQFCVSAGFAGALTEKYLVGDVLVAEAVQQLGKSKTLPCSRNLVHAARDDGAKQVKMFLTAGHVVRTPAEKAQLGPFADAVDMESFAVLDAAAARKLSAVAIRVISDTSKAEVPAFVDAMVDEKGRVNAKGVLRQMTRHPLQLPALIRLGRDSRTAAESLAHFLEAFVKKISFASHGWPPPELQEVAAR
jgi:adenosylhomocysteine nucleosidase